jgi:hypothetical protein
VLHHLPTETEWVTADKHQALVAGLGMLNS